ncbi:hypothetical protein D9613_004802 [Agrocybe pediades]|uniref:C2H2-type domain-containing protein n=1 Tax=Agrocybe pediades TaxID=84607 RepID=A0A8H4VR09_9AGAR|nr:hypothetical protein D9613_004802 [Agrocybe pediades]
MDCNIITTTSDALEQRSFASLSSTDILSTKCRVEGCLEWNSGSIPYCLKHLAMCGSEHLFWYDSLHDETDAETYISSMGVAAHSASTDSPSPGSSPPFTASSPASSPGTPETSTATSGLSRLPYTKTKNNVADPAGFESKVHHTLAVQCELIYGLEADENLSGKPCRRWFRDSTHHTKHLQRANEAGHNLHVGKDRRGYWICTWNGCGDTIKAKELLRHVQGVHLGLKFRCMVPTCTFTTEGPRKDHIIGHLNKKHPWLVIDKDTAKGFYMEIYSQESQ